MSGECVELADGDASASVSIRGAELISWTAGGAELMWSPQPQFWNRVSPILFPVVGWCNGARIRVGVRNYPMPVHGFAGHSMFEIAERSAAHVKLALRDRECTRAHYPFAFRLAVTYRLHPATIEIEIEVENDGGGPMPYACGVHPGFRWPFGEGAKEACVVTFETEERREVPMIAPGGLFSKQMRPLAFDGRNLPLDDDLFAREALCFLDARSRAVHFASPTGEKIEARFENLPHLALWSRPGAPFLCIEGWTGHGDPEGFAGDLAEKPSMRILSPGEIGRHRAEFAYRKS